MATAYARPPATMTARMVVMMRPEDKRAIEERAKELGMTTSDFIRRSGQSYEPLIDDLTLQAVAETFADNNQAMHRDLNAALDRLDATLAEIDKIRAGA